MGDFNSATIRACILAAINKVSCSSNSLVEGSKKEKCILYNYTKKCSNTNFWCFLAYHFSSKAVARFRQHIPEGFLDNFIHQHLAYAMLRADH